MGLGHRHVFKDHFSSVAEGYAKSRPSYPDELFEYIASLTTSHAYVWDCATGNGQAALGLIKHFQNVLASDASEAQILNAHHYKNIQYALFPAERTPLRVHSVDVITVAQALHWFDFKQFFNEVHRVLKPSGVIAVWCYGWMHIAPEVDTVLEYFKTQIVGSYWSPERRYVDEEYRTIPFPLKELTAPSFSLERDWNLHDVLAYLDTWSSSRLYKEKMGKEPSRHIRKDLEDIWGNPLSRRSVIWPLFVRTGRT